MKIKKKGLDIPNYFSVIRGMSKSRGPEGRIQNGEAENRHGVKKSKWTVK